MGNATLSGDPAYVCGGEEGGLHCYFSTIGRSHHPWLHEAGQHALVILFAVLLCET